MPNTTTSPNMLLPVPVVGTDPGPDWANNINACMSIIDGHNHTTGEGVPIPVTAISGFAAATFSPTFTQTHVSGGTASGAITSSTWYYYSLGGIVLVFGQVAITYSAYSSSPGVYKNSVTLPASTTTLTPAGSSITNSPSGNFFSSVLTNSSNTNVVDNSGFTVSGNGAATVSMFYMYSVN